MALFSKEKASDREGIWTFGPHGTSFENKESAKASTKRRERERREQGRVAPRLVRLKACSCWLAWLVKWVVLQDLRIRSSDLQDLSCIFLFYYFGTLCSKAGRR